MPDPQARARACLISLMRVCINRRKHFSRLSLSRRGFSVTKELSQLRWAIGSLLPFKVKLGSAKRLAWEEGSRGSSGRWRM